MWRRYLIRYERSVPQKVFSSPQKFLADRRMLCFRINIYASGLGEMGKCQCLPLSGLKLATEFRVFLLEKWWPAKPSDTRG